MSLCMHEVENNIQIKLHGAYSLTIVGCQINMFHVFRASSVHNVYRL